MFDGEVVEVDVLHYRFVPKRDQNEDGFSGPFWPQSVNHIDVYAEHIGQAWTILSAALDMPFRDGVGPPFYLAWAKQDTSDRAPGTYLPDLSLITEEPEPTDADPISTVEHDDVYFVLEADKILYRGPEEGEADEVWGRQLRKSPPSGRVLLQCREVKERRWTR